MRRWLLAFILLLTFGMVGSTYLTATPTDLPNLSSPYPIAPRTDSVSTVLEDPSPSLPPTGTSTPAQQPTSMSELSPTPTITIAVTTPIPASSTVTDLPKAPPTPTIISIPLEGRFIVVDQQEQMIHIYENGVEIRTLPCSTGLPDADKYTPAWTGVIGEYWGTFFAYDVYADDAWYLFKSQGSILIHSAPYTLVDGEKVYQDLDLLGKRSASHGCVRIHPDDARWFTDWQPEGVPIVITPPEQSSP